MNINVKTLWVQALRSGKFKQGQNKLHRDGAYCCLGVLSEIAVENGVCESRPLEFGDRLVVTYGDPGAEGMEESFLPQSVKDWAGLGSENPRVPAPGGGPETTLADLNDGGMFFEDIADLIEEQL